MKNDFSFYVPADISLVKSESGEEEHRIQGYASNDFKDRQDDVIVQKGLDISNFINYGWFNFDHNNEEILGYPDKAKTRLDSKGLYVEGTLIKGIPLADKMWKLAVALKKSNAPRQLGFSVEGKILEKDNITGKVLKAKIYNVAITPNPVNPTATWEAVCKSFTDEYSEDVMKSLSTSYETVSEEKTDGGALAKESLESALHTLSHAIGDSEDSKKHRDKLKKCFENKSLTENEAILLLQLDRGMAFNDASNIVSQCLE